MVKKKNKMSIPYFPKLIKKGWLIYILLLLLYMSYKIVIMFSLIVEQEQKIFNCEIQFNCKFYSGYPSCIKNQ